jgi:intracellular septation protein
MKQLLEFLPIVIFFLTFQLSGTTVSVGDFIFTFDGIYSATIALITATFLQILIVKLVWGAVENRLLGVALLVTVFGSATVLLRDPVFIFWKPTVVNWVLAATCVGWHVIRGRCLFEAVLPDEVQMPAQVWKRVTLVSTLHFAMVGAVNLYVAYNYSMDTWVSFKLWSLIGFSVLLVLLIGVVMGPHLKEVAKSDENNETTTF